MNLKIRIQGKSYDVDWTNQSAVMAIMNQLSSTKKIPMTKNGITQAGSLGISIPRNDRSTIVNPGDIVYSGGNLVIYTGSDDVSCTKLGHIRGCSESQIKNMLTPSSLNLELYEG